MEHLRDLSATDPARTGQTRRVRLFELCGQQARAAHARNSMKDAATARLSDAEMDAIRERAVQSFARPA